MRWVTASALLVAGCASFSPYDPIGSRDADNSYRKFEFTANSGGGWGSPTALAIFIKPFESNGKLGLCGFYTASGSSSLYTELLGTSISSHDSKLTVGDDEVGNLAFLRLNPSQQDARANCVQSRFAWKPSYAKAKMTIHLPAVRGQA